MRLFGRIDGLINNLDRAEWITPPFHKFIQIISSRYRFYPTDLRIFQVEEETREFVVSTRETIVVL